MAETVSFPPKTRANRPFFGSDTTLSLRDTSDHAFSSVPAAERWLSLVSRQKRFIHMRRAAAGRIVKRNKV